MTNEDRRLIAAIEATDRAARRLRSSLEEDEVMLARALLEDEETDAALLRSVDAFIQRFQQMHEHMTHRLYPAVYRSAELGERPPPFRALLIWLEELRMIASAQVWTIRAEIRNRLIHEYPLDPGDRRAALNAALLQAHAMLGDYDYALERISALRLIESIDDQ